MISIDTQYQILRRPKNEFSDSASLYGIWQLVGQEIVLPREERFYPPSIRWYPYFKDGIIFVIILLTPSLYTLFPPFPLPNHYKKFNL